MLKTDDILIVKIGWIKEMMQTQSVCVRAYLIIGLQTVCMYPVSRPKVWPLWQWCVHDWLQCSKDKGTIWLLLGLTTELETGAHYNSTKLNASLLKLQCVAEKKKEGRAKWQKKQNISLNEERSWQKKKNVWLVSVYQQVTFKCPRIHANDTSSQPANFPAAISGQLPSPRPASRKTSLNMNPYDHLEPDEIMAYYYYASAYSWTLAGVAYKKKSTHSTCEL